MNKKQKKEYKHLWYLKNKKRMNKLHKKWVADNKDYLKQYYKTYHKNNRKKIILRVKRWRVENRDKHLETLKNIRERTNFNGNRNKVLKRDKNSCCICGINNKSKLVVHHIDGNGRNVKNKNNNMENLITLCRSCHLKIHSKKQWR